MSTGWAKRKLLGFDSAAEPFGRRMLMLSRGSYALLLLAGLGIVFLAFRSSDAERLVKHTIEVRSSARVLFADLQTAVIRERGFLLTGNESHLEDYAQLLASLQPQLDQLKSRVADNPAQVDRLIALTPDIVTLRETMSKIVTLRRQGQNEQALSLMQSNHVQDIVKTIDSKLDRFIEAEEGLLASRQARAATVQDLLLLLIGASLVIAGALSFALENSTRRFAQDLRARADELQAEIKLRRETEATLQQAQKMEAIGQLTGGIAHDFNNMLTVIIGNLDTMKRNLAGKRDAVAAAIQARLDRQIEMALQAAHNAAKLTHRLLAFARQQPLQPARVDCNRLTTEMSELLRRTLGETVHLETVTGGGLWPILADPSQLESALLNLAVNAKHAMPDGGRLTIETANAALDEAYASQFGDLQAGQYVQISVADTGTGIRPEVLERVFEPFFTTKPAEAGSGLGLSMVHGFVKQSGGHVRIYSEVGHGTTVKMYFPRLLQETQVAAAPGALPETDTALERTRSGANILLVEDDEAVREYARSVLMELGYVVHEAPDAERALSIIKSGEPIDLIFTDVVLPGSMSGRQLIDQVKAIRPELPVLFTTGYTANAIVHHGRLDPGVQLLNKPYTQRDLARKVSQLLGSAPRSKT